MSPAARSRLGRIALAGGLSTATLAAALAAPAPIAAQAATARPTAAARDTTPPLTAPLPADSLVRTGTLPNGLRYYIRVNRRPEDRAELRLAVNAGSILETPAQRGLAHFVEHMAFNGTRHFAKNELVSYLESIGMRFGADVNASTSFDETVYTLTLPTDTAAVLEKGLQILEDWAHGQVFDSAQVAAERGVVLEEWRLGQGAGSRMRKKQFPVLFHGSRYAERLPIGDTAVITTATPSELEAFYRAWYRPDLMAVVAVGDFEAARVEAMIREHFGAIAPVRDAEPRTVFPVPTEDTTLVSVVQDPEATGSTVNVYYKHASREERTYGDYRRSIVESLYDGMMNRRLAELTQQTAPPFIGAFAGNTSLTRTADAYVLAAGVPDGGVLRGLDALLTEAERVYRHGFTATELQREKADALRNMERVYAEREKTESSSFADEYVRNFLLGEPIPGIPAEWALYRRFVPGVTLPEVDSLAQRWLRPAGRVVLVQAPEKASVPARAQLLAAFDSVAHAQIPAYEDVAADRPLVAAPPAPGRIVRTTRLDTIGVTEWTLSNGARVLLKPTDFKDDQVLLRAFAWGGTSLAPDSLLVPAVTAAAVVAAGGAGDFNRIELDKALSGKAVSVTPYISGLEEGLSGGGSPRDLETLMKLVWLTFTAPRADTVAFASFKSRIAAAYRNRSENPEAAFQDTLQVVMAQHAPRAQPLDSAWFGRMDLGESLRFYRDRFDDAGAFTFLLVGSFDVDSIRPLVERWIASLPASGHAESWRDVGIRPPPGVVERTVRKGIEPKARARIIFHGPIDYDDDRAYLLSSLADILQIRLRDVLREEMGGTYGVGVDAGASPEPYPGYSVAIDFGAAPDRLDELTRAVFTQIDSLQRSGPRSAELEKVRETQLRGRETSLRQNGFWTAYLQEMEQHDRPPAALYDFERRVRALDAAAIRDAARQYLDRKRYVEVRLVPAGS